MEVALAEAQASHIIPEAAAAIATQPLPTGSRSTRSVPRHIAVGFPIVPLIELVALAAPELHRLPSLARRPRPSMDRTRCEMLLDFIDFNHIEFSGQYSGVM